MLCPNTYLHPRFVSHKLHYVKQIQVFTKLSAVEKSQSARLTFEAQVIDRRARSANT
jgi:hypothetical protein